MDKSTSNMDAKSCQKNVEHGVLASETGSGLLLRQYQSPLSVLPSETGSGLPLRQDQSPLMCRP